MIVDKRVTLQIRISINKLLANKNNINTEIAKIISEFSHSTVIKKACMFEYGSPPKFLCVAKVHSPFWVTVLSMNSRVAFYQTAGTIGTNFGHLHWIPDWNTCGRYLKKRLFDPFGKPFLKCRKQQYVLNNRMYR